MAYTSTVPGAVSTLQAYMSTVVAANPGLDAGVYIGPPPETVSNNLLVIGSWPDALELVTEYSSTWGGLPGAGGIRVATEEYAVPCFARSWSGDVDPTSRLSEAFALLNGVREQTLLDAGGSGQLSTSGSWGEITVTMPLAGPMDGRGWGVVLAFEVHVINARLTS